MRRGDFAAAWALGDRELSRPPAPAAVTRPRHLQRIWDGRPMDGRRVLVRRGGDHSLCYTTMRLFRQTTPGSWEVPLATVRRELRHAAATRLRPRPPALQSRGA